MNRRVRIKLNVLALACAMSFSVQSLAQAPGNIFNATLQESGEKTKEISTEAVRAILVNGSAVVFDVRPPKEFAVSHIPGAVNIAPKPDTSLALYLSDVAEIERVVKGDKSKPIVIYCNGPFCGKSKRIGQELLDAGFTNVVRYQLGIPVWRALGEITQIEPGGIRYVLENDKTAVVIDARDASQFKTGTAANARSIPRSLLKPGKDVGEIKVAKEDGRLPMFDHNTRIIVFGESPDQAKALAEAIAREAFHNVSYFAGTFEQFTSAVKR